MRHRVRLTPTKKFTCVLGAKERDDRPQRAQVPRLTSVLKVQLADVQERHQVDDPHRCDERGSIQNTLNEEQC